MKAFKRLRSSIEDKLTVRRIVSEFGLSREDARRLVEENGPMLALLALELTINSRLTVWQVAEGFHGHMAKLSDEVRRCGCTAEEVVLGIERMREAGKS